jgi:hypothetical protein
MFEDMRFGDMRFDKHTYSALLQGPFQIMRQTISNNEQTTHKGISPNMGIAPYQRYEGLSSIPNMIVWIIKQGLARYRESTPNTKQSYIYKHYMRDMKVWQNMKV